MKISGMFIIFAIFLQKPTIACHLLLGAYEIENYSHSSSGPPDNQSESNYYLRHRGKLVTVTRTQANGHTTYSGKEERTETTVLVDPEADFFQCEQNSKKWLRPPRDPSTDKTGERCYRLPNGENSYISVTRKNIEGKITYSGYQEETVARPLMYPHYVFWLYDKKQKLNN
jgi:hypothetical protein